MIHGRNLIVTLDGYAIAASKNCALQLSQDFIQACSPTSGRVRNKIPTIYDWSVSVDCLIANSSMPMNLKDKLIAGTRCFLTFTDGNNERRAGFVYVKSCDESGTVGSLATFNASFESDGELYKYTKVVPQTFYEGRDIIMDVTSGGDIYLNQSQQDDLYLTSFVLLSGQKLYIEELVPDWIISTQSVSTIKQYVSNSDVQHLEEGVVKYGEGTSDEFISLSTGVYSLLIGYDDAMNIYVLTPQ